MAGKCKSGRYGSSRGGNYGCRNGDCKEPGCFGVVALLVVGLGALVGLLVVAAQYMA